MLNTPKITILEYELIINQKLFESGIVTEKQFNEVNKIIYEKIGQCNKS